MKKKTTRFMFTVPLEVYKLLKHHAINRNLSMASYTVQALIYYMKKEIE